MSPILWVILSACAGWAPAIGLWAAQRGYRARCRRDFEELRLAMEVERKVFTEKLFQLQESLTQVREEMMRERPKPGALNRTSRAEALRMLRSGLSAESAASSLGLGRREMRILERVGQTLRAQ